MRQLRERDEFFPFQVDRVVKFLEVVSILYQIQYCTKVVSCILPNLLKSSGLTKGISIRSRISLICLSRPPTVAYASSASDRAGSAESFTISCRSNQIKSFPRRVPSYHILFRCLHHNLGIPIDQPHVQHLVNGCCLVSDIECPDCIS